MAEETVVHAGDGRDRLTTKILAAARALLDTQPDTNDPDVPPFDAFWSRADRGFYALKVIDCRGEPAEAVVTWAAQEARQPMLSASGWEARLKAPGDPELIFVLLLDELRDPDTFKRDFEAEIEAMVKPTRTRVWVTTGGWVATAHADLPADVFLICGT